MNLKAILLIVFVHPIMTTIGFTIACKHLAPTQNIPKKNKSYNCYNTC
jgi:hypothetical protein